MNIIQLIFSNIFIAYVNDIRVIIEKKMVSKGGIQHLGSYVASFDDVLGDQDENDDTFMHHPLNVYNLVRHVAVGWPIVQQVFDVRIFTIVIQGISNLQFKFLIPIISSSNVNKIP